MNIRDTTKAENLPKISNNAKSDYNPRRRREWIKRAKIVRA